MTMEASTSWMFAPAAALELSRELTSSNPAGAQSALLNGKNTRPACLSSASESRRLNPSPSSATLPNSTDDHGLASWISSLVDRRVSPTASPVKASLKTTREIYSQHSYASWKRQSPQDSSWKTSGTLFPMTLTAKCSESSWNSGLILNGQLYRRRPLVETIKEIACGSMDGDRWISPRASGAAENPQNVIKRMEKRAAAGKRTGGATSGILSLEAQVKLWPTPRAQEPGRTSKGFGRGLAELVEGKAQLWPPPSASMSKGSGVNGEGRDRLDYATERGLGKDKTFEPPKGEGSLNPAWVCAHLMNWPAGWDSLEPLPPNAIKEWKEKTLAGTWWSEEPDIPRIGKNIPDRAKRLKVLGNGMVPLCFAVAFEELSR